jgi:hypothetical protein
MLGFLRHIGDFPKRFNATIDLRVVSRNAYEHANSRFPVVSSYLWASLFHGGCIDVVEVLYEKD